MVIKKSKVFIDLSGCILAFIGLFLPFLRMSAYGYKYTYKYINGDGKIVAVALIVSMILILLLKKRRKFALIPLGIALAIPIYAVLQGIAKMRDFPEVYLSYEIGFWLIVIGIGISIVMQFINFDNKKKDNINDYSQYNGVQTEMHQDNIQPMSDDSQKTIQDLIRSYDQNSNHNNNQQVPTPSLVNNSVQPQADNINSIVNSDINQQLMGNIDFQNSPIDSNQNDKFN